MRTFVLAGVGYTPTERATALIVGEGFFPPVRETLVSRDINEAFVDIASFDR